MVDELTGYGPGFELDADLCIVGTGAAGIAVAQEFLGTRTSVVVLESGGLKPEPGTDALKRGEATGMPAAGLVDGRGRSFGGTTTLWAGQCIPLDPIDFEQRDWVPDSGWPIRAAEMTPWYDRAAKVLAVPGEPHDETLWRRAWIRTSSATATPCGARGPTWAVRTAERCAGPTTCGCCCTPT
jgi:choline dehydrogenase-like flavoprotein